MKVKGTVILAVKDATPRKLPDGRMGIAFPPHADAALGNPESGDTLMALATDDPAFIEVVCLADIPPQCANPAHLAEDHLEEIEFALKMYKQSRKGVN